MASTAATNFQRGSGHLPSVVPQPQSFRKSHAPEDTPICDMNCDATRPNSQVFLRIQLSICSLPRQAQIGV